MFRFFSLFRNASEDQITDNEYDLAEIPLPERDIVENNISSTPVEKSKSNTKLLKPFSDTKPSPETVTLQQKGEQVKINKIKDELKNLSTDPQNPSGEETATSPVNKENHLLPPDLDLIKGYKEKREQKPPGVTHYKNGDREFWFVNAQHQHTGGINNDPTLRTVKIVIDENKPDFVITEGHNTEMTEDGRIKLLAENTDLAAAGGDIPESGYAAYLAHEHGIQWIGGEPSGPEFFDRMKLHQYSMEDVLAITLMFRIMGTNRDSIDQEGFDKYFPFVKTKLDPQHKMQLDNFTFDQFKDWYSRHFPPERKFLSVSRSDFIPDLNGDILHKWMVFSGEERDRHLSSLLYEQFKNHRKGVMVYGADHLNSLGPVFDQMFGSPGEYTQLVEEKHDDTAQEETLPEGAV